MYFLFAKEVFIRYELTAIEPEYVLYQYGDIHWHFRIYHIYQNEIIFNENILRCNM